MPGFKASKDRLSLLLGCNAAGEYKLKPMLICILKILGLFRIMLSTLPMCSVNGTTKVGCQHIHLQPTVETYCSNKKIPLKYYWSLTMQLVTQKL